MLNLPPLPCAQLSRCYTTPTLSGNLAWLSSKQAIRILVKYRSFLERFRSHDRRQVPPPCRAAYYPRQTGAKESRGVRHQLFSYQHRLDFTSGSQKIRKFSCSRGEEVGCSDDDKVKTVHTHRPDEESSNQNGLEEGVKSSKQSDLELSEKDVIVLAQYMTRHNFVRVLEISQSAACTLARARVLLLDKPGNIHSVYQKYKLLTDSYYDIFAALPAVIPEGPIGIFGLGAGTAARLIQHFWPEIDVHGWELDPGVIQASRKFFDMEELEWKGANSDGDRRVMRRRNSTGSYGAWKHESDEVRLRVFSAMATSPAERQGTLRVLVGDALSPDAMVEGGFAGLIVDIFAEGAVIPALQRVEIWLEMRKKLRRGGRIIVNCGGSCVEASGAEKKDGGITMRETIAALAEAFPGELSIMSMRDSPMRDRGDNSMALTGPPPDLQVWKDILPECLRPGVEDWRPFIS